MENPAANSGETADRDNKGRFAPGNEYRFPPNVSGNPTGRPKKQFLSEMADELLEEIATDPVERKAFKEALRQKLLSKGVVSAMTLDKMWERHEGKVTQPVQVDGNLNLTLSERFERAKALKDEVLGGS